MDDRAVLQEQRFIMFTANRIFQHKIVRGRINDTRQLDKGDRKVYSFVRKQLVFYDLFLIPDS